MLFVQFFQKSAISDDLIEATGDRSVVILDGRILESVNIAISRSEMVKRGYLAFQLFRGETFTRSKSISEIYHA